MALVTNKLKENTILITKLYENLQRVIKTLVCKLSPLKHPRPPPFRYSFLFISAASYDSPGGDPHASCDVKPTGDAHPSNDALASGDAHDSG